jgi:glyoxylase-like metal-dependent hydrolase (beta-lactamase superfamily II)
VPQIKAATESFPQALTSDLYLCGFHSKKSYGATSYFLQHPQGNVLVDSPRFVNSLVKRIEEMGGIRFLFLTHRDDVADHEQFQKHFNCTRVILKKDWNPGMGKIEKVLEGNAVESIAPDLQVIPVPGHTEGHAVLLFKDQYLFTGDHLAWSEDYHQLIAFRDACWYSWDIQKESMKELRKYTFEWVLPGHGRRYHTDKSSMRRELETCIRWMETR